MADQTNVTVGGGGFLKVLGIIYLVKMIRRRRRERSQRAMDCQVTEGLGGPSSGGRGRRPGA